MELRGDITFWLVPVFWAIYISMLVLRAALGVLCYTLCFMAYNDLVLVLECRALL